MIDYEYFPLGGGGGVFNKQLAEALAPRHQVTVITSHFGQLPKQEFLDDVHIRRVPVPGRMDRNVASMVSLFGFFPSSLIAGIKILQREHYDIIHSFFAIPSALPGMLLAKRFKVPHLISVLGGDIYDPTKTLSPHCTPVLKQTVSMILKNANKVISLSSDIKERALRHFDSSCAIDVIPLGIPRPSFPEMGRNEFGLGVKDKILITIGRLVSRKGVDALIGVVKESADPAIRLVVIGDGPKRSALEKCARKFGVAEQVRFMGNISDDEKFALLNIADIYVSTSIHEGFGIVFLEAMAAGLPVICYDKGGQTDFLKNGQTGYVVPLGHRAMITSAIRKIFEDNDHLHEIQKFNRKYIRQFFIDSCAKQYEQQYRQLVGDQVL